LSHVERRVFLGWPKSAPPWHKDGVQKRLLKFGESPFRTKISGLQLGASDRRKLLFLVTAGRSDWRALAQLGQKNFSTALC